MAREFFSDWRRVQLKQPTVLSIGVFDGVHRGHRHLIQQLVQLAGVQNKETVVLCFHPHPDVIVKSIQGRYYLTDLKSRTALLHELGVAKVVTVPFDEHIRQLKAEEFMAIVCERIRPAALVQGDDFALGYHREGNISHLTRLGKQYGYVLHTAKSLRIGNAKISSQQIRSKLLAGSVEEVRDQLLGRSYSIQGKIIHGKQRGRTLGFPTINLQIWEEQLLPAHGTYASWATVRGKQFMALSNLGFRPSFREARFTVEAFLIDFDEDIYGETIQLSFEKYLRPEIQFSSIQELQKQIATDVKTGVRYLSRMSG
ncbi:MAG: riboflavin biosynthesis protein RibF [Anaerolineaceae bacterium]|nr:riboflavin biosynthesis protein RibF [Anaerolineaceae bacterium]